MVVSAICTGFIAPRGPGEVYLHLLRGHTQRQRSGERDISKKTQAGRFGTALKSRFKVLTPENVSSNVYYVSSWAVVQVVFDELLQGVRVGAYEFAAVYEYCRCAVHSYCHSVLKAGTTNSALFGSACRPSVCPRRRRLPWLYLVSMSPAFSGVIWSCSS